MKNPFKIAKSIIQWTGALLLRPATRIGLGVLVIGGFLGGVTFLALFNTGMNATNTEAFCISCHSMRDTVLPELQQSVHWKNRSGVRAHCPDCHVPHDFTSKVARKMQASREVLGHLMGTIGTPEKFQEHRIVLATREWARFKANNSKECRNCHDYASMDFDKMRVTSQTTMHGAAERDASCVDCHKGIAHRLPEVKSQGNPALAALTADARGAAIDAGRDYYSVMPQPIYADEGLAREIGAIEIATGVKVLQKKKDAVQVELQLWRKNKGYARVLYGRFGMNITSAVLSQDVSRDDGVVHVIESRIDEVTGLQWQKISATVWLRGGGLVADVEPIWAVARKSYSQSCSVCHRQPNEASHDANQWPGLFGGMVGFTNMDDPTAKLVLKYLQLHSSDFVAKDGVASAH
ncbi:pentaheme c-type cytochrome TorC [Achromobacter dolens]|uniref:pentaheme c-type cytochrome TorC n=1 Tax=Achromobacter dolens TaxID=1287738 RepID=UPI0006C70BD3|nr:pentaheme c-type cytochrome TorC [Achromobacter dolens]CUJ74148.1 Cytochrome c-type protein TorC [Achromobacter dolens]